MSLYAGLDLSVSCTGLVVIDENCNVVLNECYTFDMPKKAQWFNQAQRIEGISSAIIGALTPLRPTKLCVEDYAPRFVGSAIPIIELGGIVKVKLERCLYKGATHYIPPTVLKKLITGKGNANKIEVATTLTKQYGVTFDNDNLYDAYGLAIFALGLDNDENFNSADRQLLVKWRNK